MSEPMQRCAALVLGVGVLAGCHLTQPAPVELCNDVVKARVASYGKPNYSRVDDVYGSGLYIWETKTETELKSIGLSMQQTQSGCRVRPSVSTFQR